MDNRNLSHLRCCSKSIMYVFCCECLEYNEWWRSSSVMTPRTSLFKLSTFLLLFSDSFHTGVLYSSREFSIDLKELHFKSQISMRWDDTPSTFCPISIITGDLQECLFTETHKRHPFIPTTNDLSHTNGKPEGTSLVDGGVKFGTVRWQGATVVRVCVCRI